MKKDNVSLEEELDCPNGTEPDQCFGKSAGRPRAADKEAREQALVHTAARLFMDKGYSKVSLEMIAREAHVAVRTIYVKFGGKAGLLSAAITRGRAKFFSDMTSLETDTRAMEAILGDYALRFLELVWQPAFVDLHRMVVAEARTTPELAETFYDAGPRKSREQLSQFFARPDIAPRLRNDLPPEFLAVHFVNCLMGDTMRRMLFPPDQQPSNADIRRQAARGLDLFLRSAVL
ncbi:TetR family transcriptional regulator [Duganella sp. Leaf126]|uniref:TetR/AcrR family transcriptional regulator n=1 Tax=Duganella sp. Leaf126 TaxID=1736266 RepID=UPI0006FB2186|nr:TetR/AcrR family transcriptional regulator [Duganella sp. Leaf126]KQQ33534.1 TetR family transcriptional regulator [Duganella sp. Leaf126]